MIIDDILDELDAPIHAYLANNFRCYCPQGHALDHANASDDSYLGYCHECDEDFYATECHYEKEKR
jgi:hypothetical protein